MVDIIKNVPVDVAERILEHFSTNEGLASLMSASCVCHYWRQFILSRIWLLKVSTRQKLPIPRENLMQMCLNCKCVYQFTDLDAVNVCDSCDLNDFVNLDSSRKSWMIPYEECLKIWQRKYGRNPKTRIPKSNICVDERYNLAYFNPDNYERFVSKLELFKTNTQLEVHITNNDTISPEFEILFYMHPKLSQLRISTSLQKISNEHFEINDSIYQRSHMINAFSTIERLDLQNVSVYNFLLLRKFHSLKHLSIRGRIDVRTLSDSLLTNSEKIELIALRDVEFSLESLIKLIRHSTFPSLRKFCYISNAIQRLDLDLSKPVFSDLEKITIIGIDSPLEQILNTFQWQPNASITLTMTSDLILKLRKAVISPPRISLVMLDNLKTNLDIKKIARAFIRSESEITIGNISSSFAFTLLKYVNKTKRFKFITTKLKSSELSFLKSNNFILEGLPLDCIDYFYDNFALA